MTFSSPPKRGQSFHGHAMNPAMESLRLYQMFGGFCLFVFVVAVHLFLNSIYGQYTYKIVVGWHCIG